MVDKNTTGCDVMKTSFHCISIANREAIIELIENIRTKLYKAAEQLSYGITSLRGGDYSAAAHAIGCWAIEEPLLPQLEAILAEWIALPYDDTEEKEAAHDQAKQYNKDIDKILKQKLKSE